MGDIDLVSCSSTVYPSTMGNLEVDMHAFLEEGTNLPVYDGDWGLDTAYSISKIGDNSVRHA